MQTEPTIEPTGSPIPGVIPEPVTVHQSDPSPPTTSDSTKPASRHARRHPIRVALAKLSSVIRGDKHVADADRPPASRTKER
jgi:hypothetical protein